MRFSLLTSAVLLVLHTVCAQRPNSFDLPFTQTGNTLVAGQAYLLTWSNIQGSTVTLRLRYGNPSNLAPGTGIISGLANTGSYMYAIPASTTPMSDYAIEIVDEQNEGITNYSPLFTIEAPKLTSASVSLMTTIPSPAIPTIPSSLPLSSSSSSSTISTASLVSVSTMITSMTTTESTTSSTTMTTLMGTRLQTTSTMKAAAPTAASYPLSDMMAFMAVHQAIVLMAAKGMFAI